MNTSRTNKRKRDDTGSVSSDSEQDFIEYLMNYETQDDALEIPIKDRATGKYVWVSIHQLMGPQ